MNSLQKRNPGTGFRDSKILSPPGIESGQGFSPQLTWSHYRALMRIPDEKARNFYEREAIEGGLDKRTLERQIHTQYHERCLHSQHPDKLIAEDRKLQKTATSADVGQMDGYARMFDGLFTAPDDNPSIGLILCTEKSDTVARYSVLNYRKQIFASNYLPSLPTEEQLRIEIERERKLIEAAMKERKEIGEGE